MDIAYWNCSIILQSQQTYISKYAPSYVVYKPIEVKYGPIEKQRKIKKSYGFDLSQAMLTLALSLTKNPFSDMQVLTKATQVRQ